MQHNVIDTMNSVRSNNVSLKYQRPTPSGCKDIGIRKFEFVAKTQFLLWIALELAWFKNLIKSPGKSGFPSYSTKKLRNNVR